MQMRGQARQRVIEDHARLICSILDHPGAEEFRLRVMEKHARMLVMILLPLRCSNCEDEKALRLLKVLSGAVWDLTTRIWSSATTLHCYFPDCGAKFSYASMEAQNRASLGRTEHQLQYSQYRVSLVIAPVLTLRDDREPGYLKTYGIRKAEVLVMK